MQSKYSRPIINDDVVYLAIVSPIMTIPQLMIIWSGQAQGVSKITWIAYLCVASIMLSYALKHRLKPLIVVQTCWVLVDSALVAGLLLRH